MAISQRVLFGAAVSGALLNPSGWAQHHHGGGDAHEEPEVPVVRVPLVPTDLEPFVDPLPIPPVAEPVGTHYGQPLYEVEMRMVKQQMHRDLPPTPVFTYGGVWPGPTFDIPVNQEIYVRWRNELPEYYPDWLPVRVNEHVPDKKVRTVVHLHGGVTPSASDGYPDKTWYPGESALYRYPNFDKYGGGSSLWYHDHAMGSTRLSVYSGLSGLYVLRNSELESALRLPAGEHEVPLVIQDRNVGEDGVLIYNGVCRNFAVVNGKIWPYLEVEPRRYRFRVLNANNFRILNLTLSKDVPFYLIGVDNGFLEESVPLEELLLGPAERADLIIDFSAHAGETIELNNLASCFGPYFKGEAGDVPLPHLMQFRVGQAVTSPDESAIPSHPAPAGGGFESKLSDDLVATADVVRDLTLDEKPGFLFLMENRPFHAPAITRPKLGTSEVWNLVNLTEETHPVHVHLISFKVIDRIPFREHGIEDYIRDRDLGALQEIETYLNMNAVEPAPATENGPKDVALAPNGYVTRIGMDWYGYAGDCAPREQSGTRRFARNCVTDEGEGPLGICLQELVPNHLRLLWSKAMVVSTRRKRLGKNRVR